MRMRVLTALLIVLPLWACEKQGPFERAGEKADDAVHDARKSVDDAADRVRDGIEDTRKDR